MIRVGTGYDLHTLAEDRALMLGGVRIEHEKGLTGHSDGDVVCHAIIDALFGALGLGDIGTHFPDNDSRFKDANSLDLVIAARRVIRGAGFEIANVDTTIVAERPMLRPYIVKMRQRLAECLEIQAEQVSVKAKTNEGVGPEGREEAISAQAVVLLVEDRDMTVRVS